MNITYLLGAGASYNAIPIVGELEYAFNIIGEACKNLDFVDSNPLDNTISKAKEEFDLSMKEAFEEAKIYGTIDTYAKKLSLTSDPKLGKLKTALSLFFTIWQGTENINGEIPEEHFERRRMNRKLEFRSPLFSNIDARYFGLLGNYLENVDGKVILPNNIKFLTWNYDIQLEKAISKIRNSKNIAETIDDFSFPYINADKLNPAIIHLNGIAGLYTTGTKITALHDRIRSGNNLNSLFRDLLFIISSKEASHDNHFTFAWENDPISKRALDEAKKILSETDILVIIGYSFPTFNDKIDKQIFKTVKDKGNIQMIYYQDLNADKEVLTTRFGLPENRIRTTKNVSQFILPLEFMNSEYLPPTVIISKATYGVSPDERDITVNLKDLVLRGFYQGLVLPSTFKMDDYWPGMQKTLRIQYTIDNDLKAKTYVDGETFILN